MKMCGHWICSCDLTWSSVTAVFHKYVGWNLMWLVIVPQILASWVSGYGCLNYRWTHLKMWPSKLRLKQLHLSKEFFQGIYSFKLCCLFWCVEISCEVWLVIMRQSVILYIMESCLSAFLLYLLSEYKSSKNKILYWTAK